MSGVLSYDSVIFTLGIENPSYLHEARQYLEVSLGRGMDFVDNFARAKKILSITSKILITEDMRHIRSFFSYVVLNKDLKLRALSGRVYRVHYPQFENGSYHPTSSKKPRFYPVYGPQVITINFGDASEASIFRACLKKFRKIEEDSEKQFMEGLTRSLGELKKIRGTVEGFSRQDRNEWEAQMVYRLCSDIEKHEEEKE